MGYLIDCPNCSAKTWASNMVELIQDHLGQTGTLRCIACQVEGAHIYRESTLQEQGEVWTRRICGVIPLDSGIPTYTPYVLLTADPGSAQPDGIHFGYFKDTRPSGGKLKHGHGPGGGPALGFDLLFQLLRKLGGAGLINADDLVAVAEEIRTGSR